LTIYFDTSFLVPLFHYETTSEEIEAFFETLPVGSWGTSQWTRLEFSSLTARKVGMGVVAVIDAKHAESQFELTIRDSFRLYSPAMADFDLAKRYIGEFGSGLRAGDAFHLAVAKNNRATAIYTLDKTMVKAGGELGLPVSLGIRAH
jgi:predicted nucleic acid-binding protein